MVSQELRDRLKRLKVHPREPYGDVITRALDALEARPERPGKLR